MLQVMKALRLVTSQKPLNSGVGFRPLVIFGNAPANHLVHQVVRMQHVAGPPLLVLETDLPHVSFHCEKRRFALHAVVAQAVHAMANRDVQLVHRARVGADGETKCVLEIDACRRMQKIWFFVASGLRALHWSRIMRRAGVASIAGIARGAGPCRAGAENRI